MNKVYLPKAGFVTSNKLGKFCVIDRYILRRCVAFGLLQESRDFYTREDAGLRYYWNPVALKEKTKLIEKFQFATCGLRDETCHLYARQLLAEWRAGTGQFGPP